MSYRFKEPMGRLDGGRDPEDRRMLGNDTNDPKLGDSRVFMGNVDGDKGSRDEMEDRFSKYGKVPDVGLGSDRSRRPPPFGRGRRPSPPRGDRPFKDRGRDFGFDKYNREPGHDMPLGGRDRSPVRGGFDDRFPDRFKKDDRREEHGRDDAFRPPFFDQPFRENPRGRFEGENFQPPRFEPQEDPFRFRGQDNFPVNAPPFNFPPRNDMPRPNECEIIVVNKQQSPIADDLETGIAAFPNVGRKAGDVQFKPHLRLLGAYAESVEQRLKNLGLLVDILFLKDEALLTQTIDDIARRGSLYAVVVTQQHEQHGSVTLNILFGTPQEHRNMPLDDALKLVARTFHEHVQTQREKTECGERGPFIGPPADRETQLLLRMLADGKFLSLPELDRIIRFLQDRREKTSAQEGPNAGRPAAPGNDNPPAHKDEPPHNPQDLQNRILSIINQGGTPAPGSGSPASSTNQTMGPGPQGQGLGMGQPQQPQSSSSSSGTYINFDNPSVQKALDNLMQSGPNILKNISMAGSGGTQGGNNQMGQQNPMQGNMGPYPPNNTGGSGHPGGFMGGPRLMGSMPNTGMRHPLMGTQVGNPSSMMGGGPPHRF